MLLGKISDIKSGLVLIRKKANIKYEIKETYNLITIKNIDDDGELNNEPYDLFESNDTLDSSYFTEEYDILLRLNHPNTAVFIDKQHIGLLVPSYFAIIKITSNKFLPEYVAWYLNSDNVKNELLKSQTGTYIPSTNKSVLNSIDIKLLTLEEQRNIIKFKNLYIKEQELLKNLMKEKNKHYKAIVQKILNMKTS